MRLEIATDLRIFSRCIRKEREGLSGEELASRVVAAGLASSFMDDTAQILGANDPFLSTARNVTLGVEDRVQLYMIALGEAAQRDTTAFDQRVRMVFLGAQTLAPVLAGNCAPSSRLTNYIKKTSP